MRYLLIAVGFCLAALFGLSAVASDASVDFKYPTAATQAIGTPVLDARCTPSTAQADRVLITVNPPIAAGHAVVALIAPPSAASGGGRLGVATAPVKNSYT